MTICVENYGIFSFDLKKRQCTPACCRLLLTSTLTLLMSVKKKRTEPHNVTKQIHCSLGVVLGDATCAATRPNIPVHLASSKRLISDLEYKKCPEYVQQQEQDQ